jgi:hypothetical protein
MTGALGLDSIVSQNPDVIGADVGGQMVVMSVDKGIYCGMDQTATALWLRLKTPVSVKDLIQGLIQDYQGDPEQICQDVLRTLAQLLDQSLIHDLSNP